MKDSTKILEFDTSIVMEQEIKPILLKLNQHDANKLESIMKYHNYKNKSEVIRDLIRTYHNNIYNNKKGIKNGKA